MNYLWINVTEYLQSWHRRNYLSFVVISVGLIEEQTVTDWTALQVQKRKRLAHISGKAKDAAISVFIDQFLLGIKEKGATALG